MTDDALRRMADGLDGFDPTGFDALTPDEQIALADLVADARDRQSRAFEDATHRGMKVLPRILRAPVRKILFG